MRTFSINKEQMMEIVNHKATKAIDKKKCIGVTSPYYVIEENDNVVSIYIRGRLARAIIGDFEVYSDVSLLRLDYAPEGNVVKHRSLTGSECYMKLHKYLSDNGKDINELKRFGEDSGFRVPPENWLNPYYVNKEVEGTIIYIDINSAYSAYHATIPMLTDYINMIFEMKRNATGQDRQYAKNILNMTNGYFTKVNGLEWIYNGAINYCKAKLNKTKQIARRYGADVLRTATDSIVIYDKENKLINHLDELDIGDGLGQFKLEGIYNGFTGYSVHHCIIGKEGVDKVEVKHAGVSKKVKTNITINIVRGESMTDLNNKIFNKCEVTINEKK